MLDLWQFKLCQMLCSMESTATSIMGKENVNSVMSLEYLHSVAMSLLSKSEAKGTDNEEEIDRLLGQYIRGDQTEIMSLETADLLATVLLLHDIPSKHIIQLDSNSKYLKCMLTACGYVLMLWLATLPDLYLQLKSLGVSATAVTKLLPLLQL